MHQFDHLVDGSPGWCMDTFVKHVERRILFGRQGQCGARLAKEDQKVDGRKNESCHGCSFIVRYAYRPYVWREGTLAIQIAASMTTSIAEVQVAANAIYVDNNV